MPSGVYETNGQQQHRAAEKIGRYKIFGITTKDIDYYFYIGVSRNYLCKIKSYLSWKSKQPQFDNELLSHIRSVSEIQVIQLEALPKDWDEKTARKYLEVNYLDKYTDLKNTHKHFNYIKTEPVFEKISKEVKSEIVKLYQEGLTCKEISEAVGFEESRIKYVLKKNNSNKKALFETIKKEYDGTNLKQLIDKYSLSRYYVNELKK